MGQWSERTAYNPASGTVPAVGTDTLSVSFNPTDTTDYNSASKSVALDVVLLVPA